MNLPPETAAEAALAARYGRSSSARRHTGVAVVVVLAVVLLGWVVWAGLGQARDPVDGLVSSFDVRSPHLVSVTVQITRTSTDAVRCTVVAIASDHTRVGQGVVGLPAGDSGTGQVTTAVRTEREATTADVTGCR